jgi:hypothetical protein
MLCLPRVRAIAQQGVISCWGRRDVRVSPRILMSRHGTLSLPLHDEVEEASDFLVGSLFAWSFCPEEFVQERSSGFDILTCLGGLWRVGPTIG